MDIGIRFSSPVLDEIEVALLEENFGNKTKDILEALENAPYEISIIVSLMKKLETIIEALNK